MIDMLNKPVRNDLVGTLPRLQIPFRPLELNNGTSGRGLKYDSLPNK